MSQAIALFVCELMGMISILLFIVKRISLFSLNFEQVLFLVAVEYLRILSIVSTMSFFFLSIALY